MITEGKSFNNDVLSADLISAPILFIGAGASFHSIITGSPVGTLLIEGSNDSTDRPSDIDPTTWQELTPYTENILAAKIALTFIDAVRCKWIRVRYIRTSGTGNITTNYYSVRRP